jgi:hypothetical protein
MKTLPRILCAFMLATGLFALKAFAASAPGGAHLTATINDLGASSSAKHYAEWAPIATNSVTADGSFSYTNALNLSAPRTFYRLRMP